MSEFAGIVQDELRDLRGNALTGATVIVREVGTTTPATVYNNPVQISAAGSGDTLTNDATTGIPAASGLLQPGIDAEANYTFFADSDVAYDLHVVWHGMTFDYRVQPKVIHGGGGAVDSVDGQTGAVELFDTYGQKAADETITGAWDFTTAPTINGAPIGAGGGGDPSTVFVAAFGSGTGTELDPYTGWESVLASPAPGTRFYFGGHFVTDQPLDFDLSQNIELAGGDGYIAQAPYTGGTMGTVGVPSSKITFTAGNPASWVSARYSWGFRINGLTLANASTTFAGLLVDLGGTDPDITVGARFENVTIDNTTTNGLSVACMGLDNVVEVSFRQCAFSGGQYNVTVPTGPWANAVLFEQCRFIGSTKAPIKNPLAQWTFDSCIIEPMSGSSEQATFIYADQAVSQLDVRGCYMWDAGTGAPVFRLAGNNYGVTIVGNYLSSITAAQPVFYDGDYAGFQFTGNTVNSAAQAGGQFFDGGVTITNGLIAGNSVAGSSPSASDNSADYVDNGNITKSLVIDANGTQLQPAVSLSGGGFTPPLASRLRTWVRPEELVDYANNETVGLWSDAGPNNMSPAQATGSLRPLCKTAALNGLPVVQFDGVDDYLATAPFANSSPLQPLTVVVVAKYLSNTARIFDGITLNKLFYGHDGTGLWNLYAGAGPLFTANLWDTNWHIHVVIANGASSKIYVDGGAAKAVGNAGTNGLDGLTIGAGGAGAQNMNGQIAELAITPTALTLAQINTWGAYLAAKFGLPWTTAT